MNAIVRSLLLRDTAQCAMLDFQLDPQDRLTSDQISSILCSKLAAPVYGNVVIENDIIIGYMLYEINKNILNVTRIVTKNDTKAFEFLLNDLISSLKEKTRDTIEILVTESNVDAFERLEMLGFQSLAFFNMDNIDYIQMSINIYEYGLVNNS